MMGEPAKRPRGRPFEKGRSGNPAGPKRRARSLRGLMIEALDEELEVIENGKKRCYTKKQLLARQLVDDAIKLKPSAVRNCIECLTMTEHQEGEKRLVWGPMVNGSMQGHYEYSDGYKLTMAELIKRELEVKIAVRQPNGRNRFYTKRELLAHALVNGALRSRTAAIRQLLAILGKPDLPDSNEPRIITLNIGDMEIKE